MAKAKAKRITNHRPLSTSDKIFDGFVWFFLILVFLLAFYPFYYVMLASFSNGYQFMARPNFLLPVGATFNNYIALLSQKIWVQAFFISFLRTVIGASITVFFTCLVSYALSRQDLVFGNVYRFMIVFAMYVSGGLIPFYILLRLLGMLNTFYVYIVPTALDIFYVMVGMSFFRSIPSSLVESAWLDGASEMKIFLRIILPISLPFIATLALFAAVGQWNAWLDSSYYVKDENLRTVAYRMISEVNRSRITQTTGSTGGEILQTQTVLTTQATSMICSMLPIMCVYPFLQKYFVQGIMLGAVKE